MTGYDSLGSDIILLAGGAAVLVAVLLAFRAVVEIIPVTRARRETLRRSVPVVATGLAVVYVIALVRVLLSTNPAFAAVGTAIVIVGFAVLAFGPMRDVVSGVVLKAGRVCKVGDHVRIDDLNGRIVTMGLRVLALETTDGEEAIVPYSRVARERLVRTSSGVESISPHVFRVRLPTTMSLAETKRHIRRRAMLVHWSAISRQPEVSVTADGIEVTVYPIDPDRGPDIEAEVRQALAEVDPPAAPASQLDESQARRASAE
jgi:small-conductance mechanosensitive channel